MSENNRELLTEAVARNCAAVLSLPSAGMLRHQKSRFLSESTLGLWMEVDRSESALIQELITTQQPAGISFRSGQTKVVFAAPIRELQLQHQINAETILPAVLLPVPEQIKAIQRRGNYRVRVSSASDLSARIWRLAPRVTLNDRPTPSAELRVIFRDLSIGGMGVTFQNTGEEKCKVSPEDRLRIEITSRDITILLEGRMRSPVGPQLPDAVSTGIQFKQMEGNLEGRQKLSQLTRIIGEMQREEARRARLGLG